MTPSSQEKLYRKEYARELLNIAEGDLAYAKGLFKIKEGRIENVCYHAQQCVEKALKSALVWLQIPFPLVHDA